MISILSEKELYSFDSDNIKKSLNFAKNLAKTSLNNTLHFYWRVPKEFGRKQTLPIKSAIVNNSNNSEICLWSNVDLSQNEYIKPLLPFISLKIWNPIEEIENSFLQKNLDFFKRNHIDDELCWLGGDLFRLLCLYKYGGVYLDMDMVVLRDLSPLFHYDFLYQWGSSGTTKEEPSLMINGAIMAFSKGNQNLKNILEALTNTNPQMNTFCWGRDLYGKTISKETYIFPCLWFNSEWGTENPLEAFKKSDSSKELYDGSFTWHWHNRWDQEIEIGSKFHILEEIINKKFAEI